LRQPGSRDEWNSRQLGTRMAHPQCRSSCRGQINVERGVYDKGLSLAWCSLMVLACALRLSKCPQGESSPLSSQWTFSIGNQRSNKHPLACLQVVVPTLSQAVHLFFWTVHGSGIIQYVLLPLVCSLGVVPDLPTTTCKVWAFFLLLDSRPSRGRMVGGCLDCICFYCLPAAVNQRGVELSGGGIAAGSRGKFVLSVAIN
jgi:hypothetical protein